MLKMKERKSNINIFGKYVVKFFKNIFNKENLNDF